MSIRTAAPVVPSFSNPISNTAVSNISTYLTTGYWTDNGTTPGKFNIRAGGTLTVNLEALTAEGQALALQALATWTQVSGIQFTRVTSGGQITFDDNEQGAFSYSTKSGQVITSSHVNVSTAWINSYGTDIAGYSLQTYIHEIGHALGLGHPGDYNGSATYGRDNRFVEDSWQMTIMSYFSQTQNRTTGASFAWVLTPQMADIRAIESLYGTNARAGAGNTTYGVGSNAGGVHQAIGALLEGGTLAEPISFTIMDRGGIDLLDLSTDSAAQSINLNGGTVSNSYGLRGNVIIEAGTVIENLRAGRGNDALRGNAAANTIWAGEGNDTVEGAEGNDTAEGGAGNDALWGGAGNDSLTGGDGLDWLSGEAGNDVLNGGAGVDTLIGGAGSDTLTGGDGVDSFDAGEGNDVINGDGGAERIAGALGNDKIYGGADADTLLGEAGNDSLYGGDGVDALDGGEGNDWVYGDAGAETLYGGAGNDRLYGGTEADALYGGLGNDLAEGGDVADTLWGEAGNDSLTGGAGNDVVQGGDGNDRLTGDLDDDVLIGGAGNDSLDGGAGNDTLTGGAGIDALTGGAGSDVFVLMLGDGGRDTISDFVSGTDKISLGDPAFAGDVTMIGTQAFSGAAGELRHTVSRAGITAEFDLNGDRVADVTIVLTRATALLASDFL